MTQHRIENRRSQVTKLSDFPGWPPVPSGPFSNGHSFPISLEQAFVTEIVHTFNNCVVCECLSGKQVVPYRLPMRTATASVALAALLRVNLGKSLHAIGLIEVPQRVELDLL